MPKLKPLHDVNIAQMCRDLRTKAGYTQLEMAERLGATLRAYQYWESGKQIPAGNFTAKLFLLQQELEKHR